MAPQSRVEFFLQLVVQLGRQARAEGERDAGQQEREKQRVADGQAEAKPAKEPAEIAFAAHITPAERRGGPAGFSAAFSGASIM